MTSPPNSLCPATSSPRTSGLNQPFGMLLLGDKFYVANTDGVWRFPYRNGDTHLEGAGGHGDHVHPHGVDEAGGRQGQCERYHTVIRFSRRGLPLDVNKAAPAREAAT